MTIPPGSTVTDIPGGRRVIYPTQAERLVVSFTPRPDPRDARIAELTTALRHIRDFSHDRAALENIGLDIVLDAITLMAADALLDTITLPAVDALAGEAQPSATVYEELAI